MKKEIEGKRLTLREIEERDRAGMIGLLCDGEIKKTYMIPDFGSPEEADRMFERFMVLSRDEKRFVYGIDLKGKLIGWINEVSREGRKIEVGYVIAPEEQNKGYATEALGALIPELFKAGFQRVEAGAFEENEASMRVMEKCGMKRTGQTERITYRGREHLCILYEIERGEGK